MNTIQINKPGKTTLVMVVINTGSANEVDKYKGISHFIEHMCFKGNPERTRTQIDTAIENIGGELNAYTDMDITAYWARVGNSYKNLAIDVITDLATKPLFPTKEIDKEREVIIQELKMYEDNAKTYVDEVFNKVLYDKESGFYLPVVGTKKTLYNINRDNLISYHKEKYNNPTLIIIGDVENKREIQKPYLIESIPAKLAINPKDKFVERKNLTQANILLGNSIKLSSDRWSKTDQIFCLLLLDALYGDMSGRLFESIREQNNLVYRVHFSWSFYNNGHIQWDIAAGLDKDKIEKMRDLAVKELTRPISKKDIEIIITKAIGNQEMTLDNIIKVGEIVANLLIIGVDYKELIMDYKINLKRVSKRINDFIKEMRFDNNVLAGIIPKE
jgi:predicted Zn-dependent peptidase